MHLNTRRRYALLCGSWLLTLLAGCATPEHVQRFNDGWKLGRVQAIGTAPQLGTGSFRLDCRTQADFDGSSSVFVLVRYPHGKTWRSVIAPAPPGFKPTISQEVWVQSHRCEPVQQSSQSGSGRAALQAPTSP